MPPRKRAPDREQLYLDGTAPPRNEDVELVLHAWLDATDAARAASEDKRTCRDVLIARMAEAQLTAYPYVERGTGTRRVVRIIDEPKAKTAKAPKAERADREKDMAGESSAADRAVADRMEPSAADFERWGQEDEAAATLRLRQLAENDRELKERVAAADAAGDALYGKPEPPKHKGRGKAKPAANGTSYMDHSPAADDIPSPAVFEPPDAADPFAATRGAMAERDPRPDMTLTLHAALTSAQVAEAEADVARESRRSKKNGKASAKSAGGGV